MFPPSVFVHDRPYRIIADACNMLDAKARTNSGKERDLDAFEQSLAPIEFDAVYLFHFLGVWESNGRFIDSVCYYPTERLRLERALHTFRCDTARDLVPIALRLGVQAKPYWDAGRKLPPALQREHDRVNRIATEDVKEEKLVAVLRERNSEFLVV